MRGTSTVLDAVALDREVPISTPSIRDVPYGVTQYGDLILTPSDLLHLAQTRVRTGPGTALAHGSNSSPADRGGVWAPSDFPLETSDESYLLIVPSTVERRDHYIEVLRTGDATSRIQAIRELSRFVDQKSVAAIHEAKDVREVMPGCRYSWERQCVEVLTSEDVRLAAKNALDQQSPGR